MRVYLGLFCSQYIYINSLLEELTDGHAVTYADDITLISSESTQAEAKAAAKRNIDMVYTWVTKNGLVLNAHKCEEMFILPFIRKTVSVTALNVISTGTSTKCVTELRLLVSQYYKT